MDVAPPVVPPALLESEVPAGRGDELPDAGGAAVRIGEGLEGALDDRQQREFRGQAAALDLGHDVMDVGLAAPGDAFEEVRAGGIPLNMRLNLGMLRVVRQFVATAQPRPDRSAGFGGEAGCRREGAVRVRGREDNVRRDCGSRSIGGGRGGAARRGGGVAARDDERDQHECGQAAVSSQAIHAPGEYPARPHGSTVLCRSHDRGHKLPGVPRVVPVSRLPCRA